MQSFLYVTGYYRRYISNYADLAAPLSDLTKKRQSSLEVMWNGESKKAFKKLKVVLCSYPVLANLVYDKCFELRTNASERNWSRITAICGWATTYYNVSKQIATAKRMRLFYHRKGVSANSLGDQEYRYLRLWERV